MTGPLQWAGGCTHTYNHTPWHQTHFSLEKQKAVHLIHKNVGDIDET